MSLKTRKVRNFKPDNHFYLTLKFTARRMGKTVSDLLIRFSNEGMERFYQDPKEPRPTEEQLLEMLEEEKKKSEAK
jgi:hypothetical protein